ncbi:MAG TPA: TIM barrel protein [Vicinamibacterales bacterium]|jgi:sugar phosphate isomerase/epimerase|nr:TIM barrel protein [Vicinamibacterales bacterium]
MITRREFGTITLAGVALPRFLEARIDSNVAGVRLGAQTYSFREMLRPAGESDAVDAVIKALTDSGLSECELLGAHLEPQVAASRVQPGVAPSPEAVKAREDLRRWRLETPLDHFRNVRRKFDAAGITIHAFCYNMNASFTDAELDRGFEIARALGTDVVTATTTLDVARRLAPIADKHHITVGMHGHSNVSDPNELATPESFAAVMKMSKYFKVNLDIGHFTAANYDPVAYIREHHASITNLHLKDRKKNQGDNLPWGQGDTPIREVLQLLKRERWPIPADIEYEYRGRGTPVEEVAKCVAYAKQALA